MLVVLAACSGSGTPSRTTAPTTATPPPTTVETTTTLPPVTTSVAATTRPATTVPGVTITATVAAAFASARIVQLAEPVQGFAEVAFNSSTRYRRANGSPASLADLQPGTRIQVRGTRTSSTTLLATEVILV
jgi:hypothetical protein